MSAELLYHGLLRFFSIAQALHFKYQTKNQMIYIRSILLFVYYLLSELCRKLWQIHDRAYWHIRSVQVGPSALVRQSGNGIIKLAAGVRVGTGSQLLCNDDMSAPDAPDSQLCIASGTTINEYCNIRACGGQIVIGNNCLIAQSVSIVASNHSITEGTLVAQQHWSTHPHSVYVGNDVWIGTQAVLLPGSRIGDGAVIAAGAVVRGNIPEGEVWGGVPARFLGRRHPTHANS